jgi:hypothetical protein
MIQLWTCISQSMRIVPAEQEVIISVVITPASIIATHTALMIEQTSDLARDEEYNFGVKALEFLKN